MDEGAANAVGDGIGLSRNSATCDSGFDFHELEFFGEGQGIVSRHAERVTREHIAWRLFLLRSLSRISDDAPAECVLTETQINVLRVKTNSALPLIEKISTSYFDGLRGNYRRALEESPSQVQEEADTELFQHYPTMQNEWDAFQMNLQKFQ